MENLWGMIEKVLPARLTGRDPAEDDQWDVMFVNTSGQVVRITDFKKHILIVMAALLSAFVATLCFLILFGYEKRSVNGLKGELRAAQSTISSLIDKNDELVARLVALQPEGAPASGSTDAPETSKEADNTVSAKAEPPADKAAPKTEKTESNKPVIAIENISASMVAESNQIKINFGIRKIDRQQAHVSGRTFVFLDNANDHSLRQVIPAVSIVNGRPAQINRGQFFSIARYKPMEMSTRTDYDPEDFQKATILIFSPEGELIYENTFNITVRLLAPPKPAKPRVTAAPKATLPPRATAPQPVPREATSQTATPPTTTSSTMSSRPAAESDTVGQTSTPSPTQTGDANTPAPVAAENPAPSETPENGVPPNNTQQ